MRGSVAGALWGLVLGSTGLGVASLVGEQPGTEKLPGVAEVTQPQLTAGELAPADLVDTPVDPVPALTAQAPSVPSPAPAPAETTPEADPLIAPQIIADEPVLPNVEPAALPPETAEVESPPVAEVDAAAPSQIAAAEPEPVNTLEPVPAPVQEVAVAPPVVAAPELPETAQAPVAQEIEPAPVLAEPQPVLAPEAEQTEQAIVAAPPAAPPATLAAAPVSPEVPAAKAPADPVASVVAPDPVAAAPITILPDVPTLAEADPPATIVDAPAPPSVPATEPVQSAQAGTDGPPEAAALPRVNSGVRVNRPGAEPAPIAGTPSEVITADELPEDVPALQRYAAAFENAQDWPLVSIVLLDDGRMENAEATLRDLTYPVTVILDPLQPDVATKMAAYRAAGIEVGLQVSLPLGARAQDVEVAFEAAFRMVPEAVLLFSGGDDLLQSNREITEQVTQVLAAEGLGLIAVERGLSSVLRIANQAQVPAAAVQRSLEEENVGAMGRALDQAALRARQGTGVILVGKLTPGMIDGLSDWARDAAINQIVIAPASAVLLQP